MFRVRIVLGLWLCLGLNTKFGFCFNPNILECPAQSRTRHRSKFDTRDSDWLKFHLTSHPAHNKILSVFSIRPGSGQCNTKNLFTVSSFSNSKCFQILPKASHELLFVLRAVGAAEDCSADTVWTGSIQERLFPEWKWNSFIWAGLGNQWPNSSLHSLFSLDLKHTPHETSGTEFAGYSLLWHWPDFGAHSFKKGFYELKISPSSVMLQMKVPTYAFNRDSLRHLLCVK